MDRLINRLAKLVIFKSDFDYHLMRVSLVIICFFFGYQKWFQYEADALIPYISHGPLIFWMYPVFGIRGATYVLGAAEWLFGALLFLGFWNKKLGISRSSRSLPFDDLDLYDHPVYAGWVGSLCWRLPCDDRESCIPDEGSPDFRRIFLLAEAGRGQSVDLSQTSARTEKASSLNRSLVGCLPSSNLRCTSVLVVNILRLDSKAVVKKFISGSDLKARIFGGHNVG